MSAGIKAAAAARTEQPSSTAVLTTTQADDIMAAVAATLKDGNADIDSTTAESLNDTDEELNSFRFLTSTHTQQSGQQQQPQYLQSQGSSSTTVSPSSDVNSTVNVPSSPTAAGQQQHDYDSRTHQEREDDDERVAAEYGDSLSQQNSLTSVGSPNSPQQISPGLSLLQAAAASSPPPHSYRHSRAYRHFKNPPQPHMCIRTTTENGEELFINVLSWTRIVIPQEPSDPIPLYGGMRVPPGSPRSPPIVFAVMANPEVLKDSGRHSKDPEERRAMVELMCDFVEAMNPGVKLVRNAVILKDRDISGELKDVWNAVQAQRDREREEQMLQQRQQQQQHYHNLSTNAATNGGGGGVGFTNPAGALPTHQQQQQMFSKTMLGGMAEGTPPRSRRLIMPESQTNERSTNNIGGEGDADSTVSLSMLTEQLDNKMSIDDVQEKLGHDSNRQENCVPLANNVLNNGNEPKDCQDSNAGGGGGGVMHNKNDLNNQLNANNCTAVERKMIANTHTNGCATQVSPNANDAEATTASTIVPPITADLQSQTTNVAKAPPTTNTNTNNAPPTTTPVVVVNPPTKKEKLGGFLPNGCIFPRFTKNSKHKDKDKEGKTKDKEKNALLSALKKSKDKKSQQSSGSTSGNVNQDDKQQQQQNELNNTKKTSAIHATTTNTTPTTTKTTPITSTTITANTTMQQQTSVTALINNHHNNIHTTTAAVAKNSIQQLETDVQRMDLNHAENNKTAISSSNTDPNAASTIIAANKAATTKCSSTNNTNSTTGVGVH